MLDFRKPFDWFQEFGRFEISPGIKPMGKVCLEIFRPFKGKTRIHCKRRILSLLQRLKNAIRTGQNLLSGTQPKHRTSSSRIPNHRKIRFNRAWPSFVGKRTVQALNENLQVAANSLV